MVYQKEKPICLHCGIKVKRRPNIYCSNKCQQEYQYLKNIENWKKGVLKGFSGKVKALAPWIRRYLFEKRGIKCCKCGWGERHPIDNLPLVEINHIDGNAENNNENNLEILCPNCHSRTSNFRARNKNSTRSR